MKFRKHTFLFLSLFLLITVILIGCSDEDILDMENNNDTDEEVIDNTPVEGGKVLLPLTNFKTLNPLLTENSYYYQFSKLIYEGIFEFDSNLEAVPKLAESYTVGNEGKIISIEIKDNIRWHDGEKFSTEDIGFTIDTIKRAKDSSIYKKMFINNLDINPNANLYNVINYKILDNKNIEIHYNKPYSNALEVLTFPIIPKHTFHSGFLTDSYAKALSESNYTPIGTGPYKFVDYEKYKNIKLEANEDYWGDKPYIKEIKGEIFEDEDLILTAYETGQINLASTMEVDWDKYKSNDRIKVLEYTSPNYEFIGFNFRNSIFEGEEGKKIRQAINYGIDRQDIIERVFLNHGVEVDVPIHPDSHLISPEGYAYGYDVEKSKKLLAEAGFTEKRDDGILQDENGNILSLRLLTNSNSLHRLRMAELITDYLNEIGIDVQSEFTNQYDEEIDDSLEEKQWEDFNMKIKQRDFDMVILGWEMSLTRNLGELFHSSSIAKGNNFISYNDKDTDELLREIYYSYDKEDKQDKYKDLQKDIVEKLPYVSLLFRNKGLLVDKKIMGELKPNYHNIYRGLEKSYIPKDLQ